MLYGDENKKLNQNFAFIIDKNLKDGYYEIISKNYFTTKNKFEVFGKNHDLINIKISKIIDVKLNQEVKKVNRPMYHYIIKTNKKLQVGDIGRIKKVQEYLYFYLTYFFLNLQSETIMSFKLYLQVHFSSFLALLFEAVNLAGSPALFGLNSYFRFLSTYFFAFLTISKTV